MREVASSREVQLRDDLATSRAESASLAHQLALASADVTRMRAQLAFEAAAVDLRTVKLARRVQGYAERMGLGPNAIQLRLERLMAMVERGRTGLVRPRRPDEPDTYLR